MSSLPATSLTTLVTQWRPNWATLILAIAATLWYLTLRRRIVTTGARWPRARTVMFLAGVAGYLWCTNGFPNAYSCTLLWVWAVQVLTLFLVVPVLLMAGQPAELAARTSRRRSVLAAALAARPARLLAHPFIGPIIVPIVSAALFFAHGADLWTSHTWIATTMGIVLVAIGALIAMQLTVEDHRASSLAVGAALAISVFELLTDAIPGIVLRLDTHLQTSHFAIKHASWAISPLTDQKLAGSILWGVAEMLDLPFLTVMFLRWARADEREARRLDQTRDQANQPERTVDGAVPGAPTTDEPWWLTDPRMTQLPGLTPRMRRPEH